MMYQVIRLQSTILTHAISRYRSWRFVGLHPLCAVLFSLGYALREYGAYKYLYVETDEEPLICFILSQVAIFVCP